MEPMNDAPRASVDGGMPARRRGEALLATAFEVAGVGMAFVDRQGRLLNVNEALCQMLGYQRDELIGQPWTIAAMPEVAEHSGRYLDALLANSPRFSRDWQIRRRDGSTLHALGSFRAIDDATYGRVVVITFTDISERKQAEDSLRASERRFREISEVIDEVFWIADPARRELLYLSPGYEKIWGRSVASAMADAASWLQGVHPDDQPRVRQALSMRRDGDHEIVFRVVRPDGTLRWVRDRAFPVRDDAGQVVRVTGIAADVTAEVQALDEVRRLARSLEERVAQRTAELAEQIGALKVARAALEASEQRYRYLVDNVSESIVLLQDDRVAFCNPRLAGLLALPVGRIIGHRLQEFVHPEDAPMILDRHRRRLAGEEVPTEYPLRVVRGDGKTIWVELRVSLVQWEQRPAALCLVTDVTARRALQAQLTRTLAERETILDNSIVGIFLLGADLRVQWSNRSAQQLLAMDAASIAELPVERFFADSERSAAFVDRAVASLRAGVAHREEVELVRADGTSFWALLSGKAVGPWGSGEGTVWTVMDISERKALEAKLRRASGELEAILHNTLVGIAYSVQREFQWVNRRTADILGYAPQEVIRRGTDLFHVSHASWQALGDACEPVLRRGEAFQCQWPLRRKDGSTMWADLYGVALEPGQPQRGIIWTMLDVTEQRRAQQDMQRALAKERELGELKSRFVSMTSHEFRTPLAAILSSVELLRDYRDRLPPAEQDELLGIVQASVRRMSGMLEGILTIGKAEAAALEFAPAPTDAAALTERIVADARRAAIEAGAGDVPVQLSLPRSCEPRPLDERLVRHILGNLVGNAIKYSPGGHSVRVGVELTDQATRFVVEDQGIGIPEEHLPQLFEPFYRARNVGNIGGTGLGLAIVKRAVDRHGGTIDVTSRVGEGTRFVVSLPAVDSL